jgi:hypothetical protein
MCAAELAEKMMVMRRWLDHRRSDIESFEYYKLASDVIVIQLDFANEIDAYAFAAEFSGEAVLNG